MFLSIFTIFSIKIVIYSVFHISLVFLTAGLKLLLIGSQSKGYSNGEFPKEATYSGCDPLRTLNIVCKTREQLACSFTLQKRNRSIANVVSVERNRRVIMSYLNVQPDTKSTPNRMGERWCRPPRQSWFSVLWSTDRVSLGLILLTIPVKTVVKDQHLYSAEAVMLYIMIA